MPKSACEMIIGPFRPVRAGGAREAGGIDERCRHLFTWGESVTVEKPARLRRRLAAMCAVLAAHHRAS